MQYGRARLYGAAAPLPTALLAERSVWAHPANRGLAQHLRAGVQFSKLIEEALKAAEVAPRSLVEKIRLSPPGAAARRLLEGYRSSHSSVARRRRSIAWISPISIGSSSFE